MWPSLFFVAGSDRHPHNVLHERHSSRLPAGDEAPPFQGVGTSPKCDGTDAHRYGQDASAGRHSKGIPAWFRQPGMDRGAPPGAGGSDRGNRVPARDEQRGRKGEGDVHPVAVTKPEAVICKFSCAFF